MTKTNLDKQKLWHQATRSEQEGEQNCAASGRTKWKNDAKLLIGFGAEITGAWVIGAMCEVNHIYKWPVEAHRLYFSYFHDENGETP